MSPSCVSGSIVKVFRAKCNGKHEVVIPVAPIRISAIAAVTPHFANVGALFEAWCNGALSEKKAVYTQFAALGNAALAPVLACLSERNSEKVGLLLATTKGDIDAQTNWIRGVDGGVKTGLAVPSLASSLELFRSQYTWGGPSYVVSTACTSGLVALIEAAIVLLDGEADALVTLGIDVAGDFVQDGFHALRAISPTVCRPFDVRRDGLMLGSAAASVLLERHASGNARCAITGWGITNDAVHMTAPDREAGGLIRAIEEALVSAGLKHEDIGVIFAHGTGTKYNDAMESVAIDRVFVQRGCMPAVTAAKGLIGHTLGAAGAIETVLAVEMLGKQVIPPITGLVSPEWPAIDFVSCARPSHFRHVLKIASGFGGMNAAIILSRMEEA